MENILVYLDNQIEIYYKSKEDYPSKIIMNKETNDKMKEELNKLDLSLSWKELKINNYRGILIKIKNIEFIRLE